MLSDAHGAISTKPSDLNVLANAAVPSQWIGCHPGDLKDANGNYCGVTAESVQQLTDEHLSVSEGIKRLMLAHASGKPCKF